MKQEKIIDIVWAVVNGYAIFSAFTSRSIFSTPVLLLWIGALLYSAYVRWKTAKGISILYLVMAALIVAFMVYIRILAAQLA